MGFTQHLHRFHRCCSSCKPHIRINKKWTRTYTSLTQAIGHALLEGRPRARSQFEAVSTQATCYQLRAKTIRGSVETFLAHGLIENALTMQIWYVSIRLLFDRTLGIHTLELRYNHYYSIYQEDCTFWHKFSIHKSRKPAYCPVWPHHHYHHGHYSPNKAEAL